MFLFGYSLEFVGGVVVVFLLGEVLLCFLVYKILLLCWVFVF